MARRRVAASGLCAPDRIAVVDHRDAFRGHEDALPVFSSRSVEAVLWRIEGFARTGDAVRYAESL